MPHKSNPPQPTIIPAQPGWYLARPVLIGDPDNEVVFDTEAIIAWLIAPAQDAEKDDEVGVTPIGTLIELVVGDDDWMIRPDGMFVRTGGLDNEAVDQGLAATRAYAQLMREKKSA